MIWVRSFATFISRTWHSADLQLVSQHTTAPSMGGTLFHPISWPYGEAHPEINCTEYRGYSEPSSLSFLPAVIHVLNHEVLSTHSEPATVSGTGVQQHMQPSPHPHAVHLQPENSTWKLFHPSNAASCCKAPNLRRFPPLWEHMLLCKKFNS